MTDVHEFSVIDLDAFKAKDAVDSATRQTEASAQKSASIWLPFARTITVIVALTGIGLLLVTLFRH